MRSLMAVAAMAATFAFAPAGRAADDRSDEFQKLFDALAKPEAWEGVPWKSSILEGRRIAFEQKKPLFLWCMDAKPLGSV